MFGSTPFNPSKLKAQLKMAVGRFEMLKNKKSALLKQNMRQVALMLAEDPPKEEKAQIRTEALVRDDNFIEALEILQLNCELLHERVKLLEFSKECPPDMISLVGTIIWASHRVEVPELVLVAKQLTSKFGKKFEDYVMQNTHGCLNERVVTKLSVEPPAAFLIQVYLEKICELYEVDWKPSHQLNTAEMVQPMRAPVGYSVYTGQGTGLGPSSPVGCKNNISMSTDNNKNDSSRTPPPSPPPPPANTFSGNNSIRGDNCSKVGTGSVNNRNTNSDNGGGGSGGGGIMSFFTRSKNSSSEYSPPRGMTKASTGMSIKNFNLPAPLPPRSDILGSNQASMSTINSAGTHPKEQYNGHDSDYQEIDANYVEKVLPPSTAPPGSVRGLDYDIVISPEAIVDRRDDFIDFPTHSTLPIGAGSQGDAEHDSSISTRKMFEKSADYADLVARFGQLTK